MSFNRESVTGGIRGQQIYPIPCPDEIDAARLALQQQAATDADSTKRLRRAKSQPLAKTPAR